MIPVRRPLPSDNSRKLHLRADVAAEWVAFQLHTVEIVGSNLCPETG